MRLAKAFSWLALFIAPVLFAPALAPAALAKDPPSYDKGTLLSMESTTCGMAEKGGKTVTGEILGTDGQQKKTQEVLCQEYTLQGDRLVYRIRPKDDKHPVLLPVGEAVQYRIHKDKMYLRDPESDSKEREYVVISMQLRSDVKVAKDIR
jgi:hypothetical protein